MYCEVFSEMYVCLYKFGSELELATLRSPTNYSSRPSQLVRIAQHLLVMPCTRHLAHQEIKLRNVSVACKKIQEVNPDVETNQPIHFQTYTSVRNRLKLSQVFPRHVVSLTVLTRYTLVQPKRSVYCKTMAIAVTISPPPFPPAFSLSVSDPRFTTLWMTAVLLTFKIKGWLSHKTVVPGSKDICLLLSDHTCTHKHTHTHDCVTWLVGITITRHAYRRCWKSKMDQCKWVIIKAIFIPPQFSNSLLSFESNSKPFQVCRRHRVHKTHICNGIFAFSPNIKSIWRLFNRS